MATRCWADVWSDVYEEYSPCNADRDEASDLGLCTEHLAQMKSDT